mgnify:CR=1 FL=1
MVDSVDYVNRLRQGMGMSDLIPKHGGYRKLKSFQVAQLVYDVTVRFCDRCGVGRGREEKKHRQSRTDTA